MEPQLHQETAKRITYYPQGKDYTCGAACMRMVFSAFFDKVPSEEEMETLLSTNDKIGTDPKVAIAVARSYGLEVLSGERGELDHLDQLIKQGFVILLAISVDVPHFVVYLGSNGSHSFFRDPFFGETLSRDRRKFISEKQKYPFYRWRVTPSEFVGYDFSSVASDKFWIAFRK